MIQGDELWFYYTGGRFYGVVLDKPSHRLAGAIWLAVLRRAGFISLDAGKRPGQLVTKPFVASGDQLVLDVDVRSGGYAKVEILDDCNQPVRGFRMEDRVPRRHHDTNQVVGWKPDSLIGERLEQPMRLRIVVRNASLYSFRFASSEKQFLLQTNE